MEEFIEEKEKHIPKFVKLLIILIFLIGLLVLYSRYVATKGIFVREYKIVNENITDNFNGFKIAHISDIHFNRDTNIDVLKKLVKKVNKTKPDLVVFAGDLIDKKTNLNDKYIEEIINSLSKINSNYKYAIKGNEDFNDNYLTIMNKSGFEVLDNDYRLIYNDNSIPLFVGGINSYLKDEEPTKLDKIYKYLNKNKNIFNILLLHEPDYIDNIETDSFNLVLAGHSLNGGIIIPKIGGLFKTKGCKKYYDKYYKIKNTDLYISGGIGNSNINFRLFNHPSFNLYRLTNH